MGQGCCYYLSWTGTGADLMVKAFALVAESATITSSAEWRNAATLGRSRTHRIAKPNAREVILIITSVYACDRQWHTNHDSGLLPPARENHQAYTFP